MHSYRPCIAARCSGLLSLIGSSSLTDAPLLISLRTRPTAPFSTASCSCLSRAESGPESSSAVSACGGFSCPLSRASSARSERSIAHSHRALALALTRRRDGENEQHETTDSSDDDALKDRTRR